MTTDDAALQEIRGCLVKLENQNRRLKRIGAAALAIAAAIGLMAATRPVPQKITAHEFDVVDSTGKVRIWLGVQKNGNTGVRVFDTQGAIEAMMSWDKSLGPLIELGFHNAPSSLRKLKGFPQSGMVADVIIADTPFWGPSIMLNGGSAGPSVGFGVVPVAGAGIMLTDSEGKDRADISLSPGGEPGIQLSDPAGFVLNLGGAGEVNPTTGATRHTSAASILMFGNDKKHHVIWQAP